jgi:hypothetical protein
MIRHHWQRGTQPTCEDDISMLPTGQDAAETVYLITDVVYEHRSVAVNSTSTCLARLSDDSARVP